MKELVFATNNEHKLRELREIAGEKFRILSLKDINCFDKSYYIKVIYEFSTYF